MRRGVVVVAYDCDRLRVLPDCTAEGGYGFVAVTPKTQLLKLANKDEIQANLPAGVLAANASVQRGAALDVNLSFLTIGWIRVVLHAIMSLPISLSGIGVREGSLVLLLHEYGVSGADAVALAFLLFIINLAQNSLGGIFELKNMIWPKPQGDAPVRSESP